MCKHVLLILAAALAAHLIPKSSHYIFQGVCANNGTFQWTPHYKDLQGMFFIQAFGNGSLEFGHTVIEMQGTFFFHTYGPMPDIRCQSESVCKAVAHLIT